MRKIQSVKEPGNSRFFKADAPCASKRSLYPGKGFILYGEKEVIRDFQMELRKGERVFLQERTDVENPPC